MTGFTRFTGASGASGIPSEKHATEIRVWSAPTPLSPPTMCDFPFPFKHFRSGILGNFAYGKEREKIEEPSRKTREKKTEAGDVFLIPFSFNVLRGPLAREKNPPKVFDNSVGTLIILLLARRSRPGQEGEPGKRRWKGHPPGSREKKWARCDFSLVYGPPMRYKDSLPPTGPSWGGGGRIRRSSLTSG